jgi:hypothetical protein
MGALSHSANADKANSHFFTHILVFFRLFLIAVIKSAHAIRFVIEKPIYY